MKHHLLSALSSTIATTTGQESTSIDRLTLELDKYKPPSLSHTRRKGPRVKNSMPLFTITWAAVHIYTKVATCRETLHNLT